MNGPEERAEAERATGIARMFSAIAGRYDLLNFLMTVGQDQHWRRRAAQIADLHPGDSALDVAAGTGDLTVELATRVAPNGRVVGIDFAEPMLDLARRKAERLHLPVTFQNGDALNLPFLDESFHAVTTAFGLRNFVDRDRALGEMARVIRPGGRVVILETAPARRPLTRWYMQTVLPTLGDLMAGNREAYTYLLASSQTFPEPDILAGMMQSVGLVDVTYRLFNFGTVGLHWGTKPSGRTHAVYPERHAR